jgi:iron complex transport system substrate-binding protein
VKGYALDAANALAFVSAIALASWGMGNEHEPEARRASPTAPTALAVEHGPDGSRALRDAQNMLVPLVHYERIVSATLAADRVLADLCEPDRIVAFTRYAARTGYGQRFAGKPAVDARDGLEHILALKPDLLLVSELFDPSYSARLRERGVAVFDLGPLHGLATLTRQIQQLGLLIEAPERAERYADSLVRRLKAVTGAGQKLKQRRALYLGVYGARLFGAATHTSYHDVLESAGLRDAAGEAGLSGWPELTAERVLAIDPDLVITRTGMAAIVCRHPGLERIAPCTGEGRIIELDGTLLDDPGPGMLEAAEALRAASMQL